MYGIRNIEKYIIIILRRNHYMLLSEFIMVAGLIFGYVLILGIISIISFITIELMIMRARGVKIVRKKRR